MGAPVIKDKAQVVQWVREGRTNVEISALLAEQGINVTPAAISQIRARNGERPLRVINTDLIPWTPLAPQHRNLYPAKMLRAETRVRRGEVLPVGLNHRLQTWKARMERDDLVVHYSPHEDSGFCYLPRKPGDQDFIRQPPPQRASRAR